MTQPATTPHVSWNGRRITPRVAANISIQINLSRELPPIEGRIRDIGIGGVCVLVKGAFCPAHVLSVDIPFPERPTRLFATARWQKTNAGSESTLTGLAFDDLDPRDRYFIWDFVQSRAQELAAFLVNHSEIAELGLSDLLDVGLFSRLRSVAENEVICDGPGGGANSSVFVVFRGCVKLSFDSPTDASPVGLELDEGCVFGGMPWLLGVADVETVVALSETLVLEVDRYALGWLEISRPVLSHDLARAVLRVHYLRARQLLAETDVEPAPESEALRERINELETRAAGGDSRR